MRGCAPAPARRGRWSHRGPAFVRSRTARGESRERRRSHRGNRATATRLVPPHPPSGPAPFCRPDAGSELLARNVAHRKAVSRELDRAIRVEALTGEDHNGWEARLGPYVERDAGVDEWDKRVVSLVLVATQTPRSEDRGRAVRPQLKRRSETVEIALDRGLVDIGREVTLDQQALPNDIGREILHAAMVAAANDG